ncbi:MAG: hypothetical protein GF375_06135 [Candidatus Omnitrophica bacterium]|nr:hypothetical protein [Candidatus Omnitrophota bacterium]MBD3269554.1 hypothetical protein [Candidatus Omnitrophota bacterium]
MNKSMQEALSRLKFTHLNISTTLNENFYGQLDSLNEGSLVLKEANDQLKIINLDHIVSITILNK